MRFRVRDSLCYGKAAAIASKPLAEALGFRSVRDLQKQIEKERAAGAVILSDPCGGVVLCVLPPGLFHHPTFFCFHLKDLPSMQATLHKQKK